MSTLSRLKSCSLDKLQLLLDRLDAEENNLVQERRKLEGLIDKAYAKTSDDILKIHNGDYLIDVEILEKRIKKNIDQLQKLRDKRKLIGNLYETKWLAQKQERILRGRRRVIIKDTGIFLLIIGVLCVLIVDFYQIGASGERAKIAPELSSEGSITNVSVLDGGYDYRNASITIIDYDHEGSKVATLIPVITDGKITSIKILDPGSGYSSPELIIEPKYTRSVAWTFWIIDFLCCLIFLANFFFELRLSRSKKWYWKTHIIDFVTSIPLPPLQLMFGVTDATILRSGRALRLFRLFRFFRLAFFMWRGLDQLTGILDVKLLKRSLVYGLLAMFLGAVIFLAAEAQVGGTTNNFPQSIWWSFTTLVTGGFADIHDPVSSAGKMLTVFLVIVGMVLVGIFTATLTSLLVREQTEDLAEDLAEDLKASLDRPSELD
ncbi:MAG: potassium channel family protein [Verrucomicrobiales bacterium]|nr:potassium channel family protein [Verrucomicrobiales bacterium]